MVCLKKLFRLTLLSIISLAFLVACGQKQVEVAYTVYPVQYLIERIGGDLVTTRAFADNSIAIRSQLSEDYLDIIKTSDTIFTIGGLEPYLDIINNEIKDFDPTIIELGSKGALTPFERYTTAIIDNVEVEVSSRYYDNPVFDNVDTYTNDPYIWLDPIMMTSMANEIYTYFITEIPQSKDYFEKNYDSLIMDLANLDANYAELKKLKGLSVATILPAFGRYANNYNLRISPIILSKYGNLPSDKQLEVIKARLLNDNVQYLFVEGNLDSDIMEMANSIAEDLEIELVTVYSLSNRTALQVENGEDYLHIMNQNLAELLKLENQQE